MKSKRFRGIAAVLAVVLAGLLAWPAVTASQVRTGNGYYYFLQLTNEYDEPFTDDGFASCSIYSREDNGAVRSYTHSASSLNLASAVAGPLYSSVNGLIHWYSSSTNPVDVVCYTKSGDSGRKASVTIRDHKLRIVTSGSAKVIRFPFSGGAAAKYMTSTGLFVPEGAVITDVAVQLATSPAQWAHIDVGLDGNHTVSTGSALARQIDLFGSPRFILAHNGSCFPPAANCVAADHLGAALTHVTALSGNGTLRSFRPYMVHVTGGLRVTYSTPAGSQGGHGYVFFRTLHVGSTVMGAGY